MTHEATGAAKETTLPRTLAARAWRQPALLLSFAYFATSAIGLWSSYWYYRAFGVPVLEFMAVTDFLAAGLRDPAFLFIIVFAVALSWVLGMPERWAARNPERVDALMQRWWWRWIVAPHWQARVRDRIGFVTGEGWLAVGIVWMSLWILFAYVTGQAKDIIKRDGGRVVAFSADAEVRAGLCAKPRLIGTTSLYVFLYCGESRTVEVVPVESVGRLTFALAAPDKATSEAVP
ncbi:hypothetical protein [Tahibacter soli]|jgi:hypothetical protein|uniref:Uncharacterized protein n=1 Tax=Tahibacter soli TaxID=2983605 RepID=A0A9X4BG27_9GAMM|nr:hypothetical protein [Tahibacter soli]MDC8012120.1 hypothetical protein [Tahibacter soli]